MIKTRDLKPDIVLKNYWSDNAQFADLFNAVLFHGEQVIRPEKLEEADTEEASILEHRDHLESIKASRDNIKVSKKSTEHGVEFVMLGLESQERIHYAMPMRVMGYDYGAYKKQYDNNARKYKSSDGMEEDEYLSRMKRTDRFMPVITIVVYYGERPWDGAVSLHEMLNIPERMKIFVNDYKMMLVEARQNNLKFHNINNKDFFNMLKIILDKNILKYEAIEGRAEGKIEGRAEGIIETGFDCGLSENDILERLQNKLDVSLQMAQEYLKRFGKQKKQIF